jgi:hypothetical protein
MTWLARRLALGSLNLVLLGIRRHLWRLHPHRFVKDIDSIPIDRPIFLLGTQGGGLTLIARALRRHPRSVSVTGNCSYWAGPDEMHSVMEDCLPPQLGGIKNKIPPHSRFPKRDWLYAVDEMLPLYRQQASNATPEMAGQFRRAIRLAIAVHARDPQGARFVDKSQTFTVRLSLVNKLLEGCQPRFMLITRNPYAICYRAAFVATPISKLDLSPQKKLRLAAQHWRNSFRCAIEDAHEVDHCMTLRFEDFLKEPEKWLREISQFAQLEYLPSMLPAPEHRIPLGSTGSSMGDHKWYPLRCNVNHLYLKQLEPWMMEIIDNSVRALTKQWNYSLEGP